MSTTHIFDLIKAQKHAGDAHLVICHSNFAAFCSPYSLKKLYAWIQTWCLKSRSNITLYWNRIMKESQSLNSYLKTGITKWNRERLCMVSCHWPLTTLRFWIWRFWSGGTNTWSWDYKDASILPPIVTFGVWVNHHIPLTVLIFFLMRFSFLYQIACYNLKNIFSWLYVLLHNKRL